MFDYIEMKRLKELGFTFSLDGYMAEEIDALLEIDQVYNEQRALKSKGKKRGS